MSAEETRPSVDDLRSVVSDCHDAADAIRDRIDDLRSENNELKQRIGDLIDAIYEHREKVSVGYGIGSYKTAHAANMELWKAIGRK